MYFFCLQQYKLSRFWEGYKLPATRNDQKGPCFRVGKTYSIIRWDSNYEVELGLDKNQPYNYKIESSSCKPACKIFDKLGVIVAEVKFFNQSLVNNINIYECYNYM